MLAKSLLVRRSWGEVDFIVGLVLGEVCIAHLAVCWWVNSCSDRSTDS